MPCFSTFIQNMELLGVGVFVVGLGFFFGVFCWVFFVKVAFGRQFGLSLFQVIV